MAALKRINDVLPELMGAEERAKTHQTALTAKEMRRLPSQEREAILAAQTQFALQDFEYLGGV
jgi:hypothetical protein